MSNGIINGYNIILVNGNNSDNNNNMLKLFNNVILKNTTANENTLSIGNRNNSYLNTNNGYTTWNLDRNKLDYRNWGMDYAIYFSNNKWDVYR